ncbi:hypothetical protein EDD15DRAFT_2358115 [Pisolithus albus]|nr:hypothetical protein EDD15DRAFT_2358115 [Pisolithus albus]
MIATRHLPENFSFTIDPSHMRLSAALDLLNFWHERQIANPNDVFSFQKWLDQSGNLWEPSDGSVRPLEVARKRKRQSWEVSRSSNGSTSDEDGDPDDEDEGTSSRPPLSNTSAGSSRVTSCPRQKNPLPRKKTPMPRKVTCHTMDDEGQNPTDKEDLCSNENADLPVLANPPKRQRPAIQKQVLQDNSNHQDSDGFESIPFADAPTAKPGPSSQRRINGKLKPALKQTPRLELQNEDWQAESQMINGDSSASKPRPRKPAPKKATISGTGKDQDCDRLLPAEGSLRKSPRPRHAPIPPDANVPSQKAKNHRRQ